MAVPMVALAQIAQPAFEQAQRQPDSDLSEPLEVGQQQRDQFFAPRTRPPVEDDRDINLSTPDPLIEPPPGTQTPDVVTPGGRLSVPIR